MQDMNDNQREVYRKLKQSKGSKNKGEQKPEEIEIFVDQLINSMNEAVIADRESNKNRQYALRRLQLANKVYPELRKKDV